METLIIRMGSNSTTIYREGEGVVLKEASLVAVSGGGKTQVIKAIGNKARHILGRTSPDVEVTSPIFEGVVSDNVLASEMLKYFIEKIYGTSLFRPRICAIMSVPIGVSEAEKKAFEKVCYNAKILDVELLPSVFCGALGMNLDVHTPRAVMVVSIGGTITNIGVLSLNTIINGLCVNVGGKNIDNAIVNDIKNRLRMEISEDVAEKIKKEAGSLYKNDSLKIDIEGVDIDTRGIRKETIYSKDLYEILTYYYDKVADGILAVLNSCMPDIVSDIKNDSIYIYGGSTKINGLEYYLRNKIKIKVDVIDDRSDLEITGAEKLLDNPKQLEAILRNL